MASTFNDRVDGISTTTALKAPVRVATTAAITLSGTQTIDGIALVPDDRVLVKNQASAVDNGIRIVAAGAWPRAKDFNGARDARNGTRVYVNEGTTNGGTRWSLSVTSEPIAFGTDSLTWLPDATTGTEITDWISIVTATGATDNGDATYAATGISGDQTSTYHTGRRARLTGATTGTVYATIVDSSYSTTTSVTVKDVVDGAGDVATISDESLTMHAGLIPNISASAPFLRWTPQMLGAKGDGSTDDTEAFEAFAALTEDKHIPTGAYVVKKQINFTASSHITFGDVTLDFSTATTSGDFADNACLFFDGGALTALPDLGSDPSAGDHSLTFSSAPSLSVGDVFLIYNPTQASFHGAENAYHAGEILRAQSVSGSTVTVFGSLFAGYTASAVEVHKLSGVSISLQGTKLKVIAPDSLNAVRGIEFKRLVDSHVSGISGSNSGNAAVMIAQCYNFSGYGYSIQQDENGGSGTDYGLVIANSQKVISEGSFWGRYRGMQLGGEDETGAVPCRECLSRGTFSNHSGSGVGVGAVVAHANAEHYEFDGIFNGGITPGGDYGRFSGQIFVMDGKDGVAVYFGNMLGWHFNLSGLMIKAFGDPNGTSRGTIDLGGNSSSQATSDTTRGGLLDLSGIQINAPDSQFAVKIRNRGSAPSEPIVVDMRGMEATSLNASITTGVFLDAVSGNDFAALKVDGVVMDNNPAWNISNVTAIRGWRESGEKELTTTTGIATISGAVTFTRKAPKAPKITVSHEASAIGTNVAAAGAESETTTGFTARLSTHDGTNFGAAVTRAIHWHASIDE